VIVSESIAQRRPRRIRLMQGNYVFLLKGGLVKGSISHVREGLSFAKSCECYEDVVKRGFG